MTGELTESKRGTTDRADIKGILTDKTSRIGEVTDWPIRGLTDRTD